MIPEAFDINKITIDATQHQSTWTMDNTLSPACWINQTQNHTEYKQSVHTKSYTQKCQPRFQQSKNTKPTRGVTHLIHQIQCILFNNQQIQYLTISIYSFIAPSRCTQSASITIHLAS